MAFPGQDEANATAATLMAQEGTAPATIEALRTQPVSRADVSSLPSSDLKWMGNDLADLPQYLASRRSVEPDEFSRGPTRIPQQDVSSAAPGWGPEQEQALNTLFDQVDKEHGIGSAPMQKPESLGGTSVRHLGESWTSTKQMGHGLVAMAADGLARAGVAPDTMNALRNYSLEKYQALGKEQESQAHDYDSFSQAYKSGDFGQLSHWAAGAFGDAIGFIAQQAAVTVAGGAIGSMVAPGAGTIAGAVGATVDGAAARGIIDRILAGMVSKRIAEIGATDAGKALTEDQIKQAAVRGTFDAFANAGRLGAGTAFNVGLGEGATYGAATGGDKNAELSGGDFAKAATFGAASGLISEAATMLGLKGIQGELPGMAKLGGMSAPARIGAGAAIGAGVGGTEMAAMGALQDIGAGKDVTAENTLNRVASGAVMGAGPGVLGGIASRQAHEKAEALQKIFTDQDAVKAALDAAELGSQHLRELTDATTTLLQPNPLESTVAGFPEPQKLLGYHERDPLTGKPFEGEVLDANGLPPRGPGEGSLPAPEQRPALTFQPPKPFGEEAASRRIEEAAMQNPASKGAPDTESYIGERLAHAAAQGEEQRKTQEMLAADQRAAAPPGERETATESLANAAVKGENERSLLADTYQRNIEKRGGVALPHEAAYLAETGSGKPYDRIAERPAEPVSDVIQLSKARVTDNELSRVVTKERGAGAEPMKITSVERESLPKTSPDKTQLTRNIAGLISQIARKFGMDVKFYTATGERPPEGFVHRGTVYVNTTSKTPHLAVFGHEFFHRLNRDNPELGRTFMDAVSKNLSPGDQEQFKKSYGWSQADEKSRPGGHVEEISGDLFGNRMMRPEFWSDVYRKIGEANPDRPALMARVGALVARMVRHVTRGLEGQGFVAEGWVRDLKAVDDAASTALARYAVERQMPARQMEAERLKAAHDMSRLAIKRQQEENANGTIEGSGTQGAERPEAGAVPRVLRDAQAGVEAGVRANAPESQGSESSKPGVGRGTNGENAEGVAESRPRREDYEWKNIELGNKGDVFVGRKYTLDPIRQLGTKDFHMGLPPVMGEGHRIVRYNILDNETQRHVGVTDLQHDADGNIVALRNIAVSPEARGSGVAREVVGNLAANAANLKVHNIEPSAEGFWSKVGTGAKDPYNDAALDWHSYASAHSRGGVDARSERSEEPARLSKDEAGDQPQPKQEPGGGRDERTNEPPAERAGTHGVDDGRAEPDAGQPGHVEGESGPPGVAESRPRDETGKAGLKARIASAGAKSPESKDVEFAKVGDGVYTVTRDGREIGRANLAERGDYLTSVRLDAEDRRQGIGTRLYNFVERDIGKRLVPSPTHQTGEAKAFWAKRNQPVDTLLLRDVAKAADEGGGWAASHKLPGGADAIARLIESGALIEDGGYVRLSDYGEKALGDIAESRARVDDYHLFQGIERPKAKPSPLTDSLRKIFAPASRGPIAARMAGIMRGNFGEMAREQEIAVKKLFDSAKQFNKLSQAESVKFIDTAMERGQTEDLPAWQRKDAESFREMLDYKREQVQGLGTGALEHFNANYFPHIYKEHDEAQKLFSRRPLEGSKAFLKKRTIPYLTDALRWRAYDSDGDFVRSFDTEGEAKAAADAADGHTGKPLQLLTSNPAEMVLLKMREMDRYIYGQRVFAEMKDADMARFVARDQHAPDGWTKIDDKIAKVGMGLQGEYWAPDQAATLLNNHLSPGLQGNRIYDAFRRVGTMMNSLQLGLAAFHVGFTTGDAMVSKVALGVKQTGRGDITDGLATIAQGLNPVQPLINYLKGDKLLKAYLGDLDSPEMAPIVDALQQAGGRVHMDPFYRNATVNAFKQALKRGDMKGAALEFLPTVMDRIAAPIFEHLVPRQKLGVFFDMAKDWIGKNPDATLEEKRYELGKMWDSVDNRMGQLVYDNLFWHRALKDGLMATVRSVGWNLGTFRELGGGIKDIPQALREKKLSDRTAYLIALPMAAALYGSVTQYLYTGEGPESLLDAFYPRTGAKRPDGSIDRVSLPTYMKDVVAYGKDINDFLKYGSNPTQTLQNKLHPMLSTIGQMMSNQDFFGGAIRSPGDPWVQQIQDEAGYLMKQIEPFSIRNYQQQSKTKGEEQTLGGYLTSPSMIGITPAPGYVTKDAKQEESAQISRLRQPIMTKFREALQNGDIAPAEARTRMLAAGLTPPEVTQVLKAGARGQQPRPAGKMRSFKEPQSFGAEA